MLGSIKAAIQDVAPARSAIATSSHQGHGYTSFIPYGSSRTSGAYFLFAGLPRHEGIRLLPVDRLALLEVLDNTFTTNLETELDSLLAHNLDLSDSVLVAGRGPYCREPGGLDTGASYWPFPEGRHQPRRFIHHHGYDYPFPMTSCSTSFSRSWSRDRFAARIA